MRIWVALLTCCVFGNRLIDNWASENTTYSMENYIQVVMAFRSSASLDEERLLGEEKFEPPKGKDKRTYKTLLPYSLILNCILVIGIIGYSLMPAKAYIPNEIYCKSFNQYYSSFTDLFISTCSLCCGIQNRSIQRRTKRGQIRVSRVFKRR